MTHDLTREASPPHASDDWEAEDLPTNDHPWGAEVHRDIHHRDPVTGQTVGPGIDGLTQNEADVLADQQHEWIDR